MRSPDNELSAHTIIRPKRLQLIKHSPQFLTPDDALRLAPWNVKRKGDDQ
jgi:hypothetical protein